MQVRSIVICSLLFVFSRASGQTEQGRRFITGNLSLSLNPETSTPSRTSSGLIAISGKDNSVSSGLSFGKFIKDGTAWYAGLYYSSQENLSETNTPYNDSTYSRSSNSSSNLQGGLTIGLRKFIPLWQQKLFLAFNHSLSGGYIRTQQTATSENLYSTFLYRNHQTTDNSGFTASLSLGVNMFFFFNPKWALSSGVNLASVAYTYQSGTTTTDRLDGGSTVYSYDLKNEINDFSLRLNPFVNPFGLSWGVSYFF